MMRLWGGALIVAGGMFLREGILAGRRERIESLRTVISELRTLCIEIRATLLPLPVLLRRKVAGGAKDSFITAVLKRYDGWEERNFAEAWIGTAFTLPLHVQDRQRIAAIAESFSGTEEYVVRAFTVGVEELEKELWREETQLREQRHLLTTICLSGSIFLSILLV